jgi:ABC-type antimicrobial peptide transport system permease subunit
MGVVSYMNLAFEMSRRDFGIMRGIGAPPKHIKKTILRQGMIVSLWPGISGIIVGLTVAVYFFIPAAVVTPLLMLISMTSLLLLLFLASFVASLISTRVSRKAPIEMMK